MARPKKGEKSHARKEVEKRVYEYLTAVGYEYEATKIPTLPCSSDGKINVSELAENMGLTEAQRKNHLYKDENIIKEINRHAMLQNLSPIGESKYKKALEDDAKHQIFTHSKRAKQSVEQLVEVQSQNAELIIENKKLKAEIERLKNSINEFYNCGTLPNTGPCNDL